MMYTPRNFIFVLLGVFSQTLHGQEVCGSRLKVMTAEPPNATNNDTLRKRIRIEEQ